MRWQSKKDDEQATGAIDAATFDILTKAQELTENGKFNEAVQTLDKLKGNTKMNSYAKSQMWNFYAYIYANQEKYKSAIDAYKKLLAEPDAPGRSEANREIHYRAALLSARRLQSQSSVSWRNG